MMLAPGWRPPLEAIGHQEPSWAAPRVVPGEKHEGEGAGKAG